MERKDETEVTDKKFNLYKLGDVRLAENHGSANRSLRKIKDVDETCEFCPCCYLPGEKENFLVQFKTCDSPDDFSDSGQGIVLYYSFIKFCLIVMAVTCIYMCCFNIYFSYKYNKNIIKNMKFERIDYI